MTKLNLLNRGFRSALIGAAVFAFGAIEAQAAPVVVATIADQVDVAATNGTNAYSGYSSATFANQLRNGRYWGDSIQGANDPFNTTQIVVTRDNAASTIQFDLKTQFNGNDGIANYADLFFDTRTAGPDSFNYSIALGSQTRAAGLYNNTTFATSEDIWKTRTQYVYGGGFQFKTTAPGYDPNFFSKSPVRSLTGTQVSGYTVGVTQLNLGGGMYDIRVIITSATNLSLFDNFDIFWGTADCSNDAIWGQVTNTVPTPGGLGLLGLGLLGLFAFSRRRQTV
jgi:hypothetical protein